MTELLSDAELERVVEEFNAEAETALLALLAQGREVGEGGLLVSVVTPWAMGAPVPEEGVAIG